MTLSWLGRSGQKHGQSPRRRRGRGKLVVERLEDRTVPATAFAVTGTNTLIQFDTATPGTVTTIGAVTGLAGGENILGMDFRPTTGELFGLGSANNLYTIDTTTAAATLRAALAADPTDLTNPFTALGGGFFGVDFNPVPDLAGNPSLRVTSDTEENLRINANNGLVTTDTNITTDIDVEAVAYTNIDLDPATGTTLFGISAQNDTLVTAAVPNNGAYTAVGSLGVTTGDQIAFDVQTVSGVNTAFLALSDAGSDAMLYTVDLTGGAATLVGTIGPAMTLIRGFAIAPAGNFVFSAPTYSTGESGPVATITVNRLGGSVGTASVTVTPSDGTATAPADYDATPQTATFGPGVTSQTVTIPLTNDDFPEGDETVNLTLSNPTGGAQLGTQTTAVLTITDDDVLQAANAFGVTDTNDLIRFNTAAPGTIVSTVPITGLAGGETVLGIDFRPATGQLFALGSTSRLYTIDQTTGEATAVGTAGALTLTGTEFGFDFNPTVDRIRVVSEANQNIRLNPNDGSLVDFNAGMPGVQPDLDLVYAAIDPNAGANPNVVASAYLNSVNGATTTTLYGIDTALDILVIQNPPNNGVLNTVGGLGVDASDVLGFDIRGATNTAYASLVVGGTPSLYLINLATGQASEIGALGGLTVRGFALAGQGFGNTTLVVNTATFNGGTASDTITFDQSGGLLRHNRFSAGDPGFSSDFDFDPATPGDQTLSATDPAVTIIVNSGGADDAVTIGSATAPASGLAATFQVNGQGGGDQLTIENTADGADRTITIDSTTAAVTGLGGSVTFGSLEGLTVNAGGGGDTINVLGTATIPTSVNAGDGDDAVVFGDGAALGGGLLDGGAGSNTLDYSAYTSTVEVDMSPAGAQTLFLATLSGATEPGPLSSSPASGVGVFTLNAAQTDLSFTITYQGLQGSPISGTHFHNQAAGLNGPIVRGLFPFEQNGLVTPSGTFFGTWSANDPTLDPPAVDAPIRPLTAPSPVTPGSTLVQELLAGRIYFNLHTLPNFPSGEIRGQLVSQGTVGRATGSGGVRGFDNVTGGSATDVITGNANVNILRGGPGADIITGGQGGDQLFGDEDSDTLIWNNGDGSDLMEGGDGPDTVQVNGSPTGGDQFLIQVNPADPTRLRFDRTNLGLFNLNIGTTEFLDFNTLGGDDTLTVDFAGGNPIPANGIDFDGGFGDEGTPATDSLVLQRSAGTFTATEQDYFAFGSDSGVINIDGSPLFFSSLTPIDDTVPATNFTFTAPFSGTTINLIDGPVASGFQTAQINDGGTSTFELINFANKTNVTINSDTGPQTVVLNNPTAADGLASLTVNANNAADFVTATAVPPGVATTVNTLGNSDAVSVTGAGVPTGTTATIDGGAGFDTLNYDAGGAAVTVTAGPMAGQTTITRDGSGTVVYLNFEQVNVFNAAPTPIVGVDPAPTVTGIEGVVLADVVVAQFTGDPTTSANQYEVTIDWGDGTLPSAGTAARDPSDPALFNVTGSHTYDSPGTFTITITVGNPGGTTTTFVDGVPVTTTFQPGTPVTFTTPDVTIADAPLAAAGATITAVEDTATGTVTVATFTDAGGAEDVGTYFVTIDWGDGTALDTVTPVVVGTPPDGVTFLVPGNHTYADAGTFPITVTITSGGGSVAVATGTANVAPAPNTPPTISDIGDQSGAPGIPTAAIPFTIGDAETAADSLLISVSSSNTDLVPISGIMLGGSGANRTVTITPTANQSGSSVITLTVTDAGGLTATDTFTVSVPPVSPPPPAGPQPLAVSGAPTGTALVFTPDPANPGQYQTPPTTTPNVFGGFGGLVRVATGDVNGDGFADTILVTGPGTQGLFAIVNGKDNSVLVSATDPIGVDPVFGPFTAGLYVSAGDIDGDGRAEWVISPEDLGGPRTVIFRLNGTTPTLVSNFFGISDSQFRGGQRTALGDVDNDGFLDVICIAAAKGGPRMAIFDGASVIATGPSGTPAKLLANDIFVADPNSRSGLFIASGDVNGDGFADVVVTNDPQVANGAEVRVLSGADLMNQDATPTLLADFTVGGVNAAGGLRVGTTNLDGDDRADVVVGSGAAQPSQVKVYLGTNVVPGGEPDFLALDPFNGAILTDGVFVG